MDLNKLWTNCKLNNVTRMTLFWPWVLHWQICDWFVSVALTEAMLFVAIDGKNWKIKLIQTSKFLIYFFVVLTSCKTWRSIFIKFMPIESMKEKLMVGLILTFALSSQNIKTVSLNENTMGNEEMHLRLYQTPMMELIYENGYSLKAAIYFCKKLHHRF